MGALIGFIVGYLVGAQAGPESIEKLRRAWGEIRDNDEFKGLVATATSYLEQALGQGSGALADQVRTFTSDAGELGEVWRRISSTGDVAGAWATISQSTDLQGWLSAGMSFFDGVLAQGKTMAGERLASGREGDGRP